MSQTKLSISQQQKKDRLARFRDALKTSRAIQEMKLAIGVKAVDYIVQDVESDWLENWDDQDEE